MGLGTGIQPSTQGSRAWWGGEACAVGTRVPGTGRGGGREKRGGERRKGESCKKMKSGETRKKERERTDRKKRKKTQG